MSKFLIGLATVAAVVAATAMPAVARTSSSPAYLTEIRMGQMFQENGITLHGRHRTVLDAVCSGAGLPKGSFPYERFHIFECYIRAAGQTGAVPPQYRVTTTNTTYSYQLIPGF